MMLYTYISGFDNKFIIFNNNDIQKYKIEYKFYREILYNDVKYYRDSIKDTIKKLLTYKKIYSKQTIEQFKRNKKIKKYLNIYNLSFEQQLLLINKEFLDYIKISKTKEYIDK